MTPEEMKLVAELTPLMELKKAMEPSATEKLMADVQKVLGSHPLGSLEFLARAVEEYKTMEAPKTSFELAMDRLKSQVPQMPKGFQFEITQIVGNDVWSQLDRSSKLALGKHVKASQETYGLKYLTKSASNHAIYTRADD